MALINYCNIQTDNIPESSGIYFFYENDRLLYIGKSKNMKKRIKHHISVNKNIHNRREPSHIDMVLHRVNRIEYQEYPVYELPWIELFYICRLIPVLNCETRQEYPELDEYLESKLKIQREINMNQISNYWKRIAKKET